MDWNIIRRELEAAVVQAIGNVIAETNDRRLYAIALYTTDDGMNVAMAANTEEFYREHLIAESVDEPNSAEDELYYRWSPSEWRFERWNSDVLKKANQYLLQQVGEDQPAYLERLVEVMTTALVGGRETYREKLRDVTIFVTLTDSDEAEAIEKRSAMAINPPEIAQGFIARAV